MLEVEQSDACISLADSVSTLVHECSAITDYRILRDSLPKRLAHLLKCRCVLLYQKVGETLQFASGTYDEQPGWSAALLSVVHINPVALSSDVPEAQVWRTQTSVAFPSLTPTHVVCPLHYRQRCTGVLVAIRGGTDMGTDERERYSLASSWTLDDVHAVTAIADVASLLLENTRLLERDRERTHTLSLLTTLNSQMTYTLYEAERLRTIVMQRMREIARVDVCDMVAFSLPEEHGPWVTPALCATLLAYFNEQPSSLPLVIERPGDVKNIHSADILQLVPATIKTFFAFPLIGSRPFARQGRSARKTQSEKQILETRILGVVVGGYQQPWKLRREEATLLQVVVSQASAILENMQLVAEVVEARNEARKLLRRVLEDQRLKALILESIPSGLITIDMQGRITVFNTAAQTILGYQTQEVLGKSLEVLLKIHASAEHEGSHYFLNATSSPLSKDALQHVLSKNELQRGTLLTSDQQGQELVLDIDIQPLCNDAGKQVGALMTCTDVTSVHRLEEEKRRLDRLASLGEMAANVAHEVRNPLASIKTSIQMLMDDLTDDDEQGTVQEVPSRVELAQESTTVMLKEVERLDSIVRDMLLFAKPRQLHRSTCNIIALSDHVLQLMQKRYTDAQVHIHRVYEVVPALYVDTGQIEQVLFNLYTNALQAMPEGGELTVTCRMMAQTSEPRLKHAAEPQQWLVFTVADTGVGISPDALKRIFQPFFTTKAHGIGLGLPITRRLIEDHGGTLSVESQLGKGTIMTVCLPLLASTVEEEK